MVRNFEPLACDIAKGEPFWAVIGPGREAVLGMEWIWEQRASIVRGSTPSNAEITQDTGRSRGKEKWDQGPWPPAKATVLSE